MAVINVRGVNFSFNGVPILEDVSLQLEEETIAAVIGPNGSGKSTLLRCVMNILSPETGRIAVNGKNPATASTMDLARNLAYLPQRLDTAFPMEVFDLVLTGRRPHIAWRPTEQDIETVWAVMRRVGVEELADRSISELSGGEAQKVYLARALAQDCRCMLLDEPTGSLDVYHQLHVMEMLRHMAHEDGKSMLLALHDLNLAARFVDKLYLMHGGKIAARGTPEAVLTRENMRAVYGVDARVCKRQDGLCVACKTPHQTGGPNR